MPACTRAGHIEPKIFARPFGAEWVENLDDTLPYQLNAALTTRPIAVLDIVALGTVSLVSAAAHISDITSISLDVLHRQWRTILIADVIQPDG